MEPRNLIVPIVAAAVRTVAAWLLMPPIAPAAAAPASAPVVDPRAAPATAPGFAPRAAPPVEPTGHLRSTAAVGPAAAPLAPPTLAPEGGLADGQPGVLLLRNGEILAGRIARVGDYYDVVLPEGRLRLGAAQVEMACRDLEEGYQRKRAAVRPGDARGHLRLAWWCMRHELLGHAAAELADGAQLDPDDPLIELLRRRLELALSAPGVSSAPAAAPATAGAGDPAKTVDSVAQSGPSLEELDRLVRELPPGAAGQFRQVIQPLLWNSCGSGQCHGAQSSGQFRLLRAPHGQVPTLRLTQRNLHSVLGQLDRANPEQSPLLRAARTAHGTMRSAPGTGNQQGLAPIDTTQYRVLAAWVAGLGAAQAQVQPGAAQAQHSGAQMPQGTAEVQQAASLLPQTPTAADLAGVPAEGNAQPAVFAAPIDGQFEQSVLAPLSTAATALGPPLGPPSTPAAQGLAGPAPLGGAVRETPGLKGSVQYGARLEVFEPVDPFDPEIFNRRYFPGTAEIPPAASSPGADGAGGEAGGSDTQRLPEAQPLPSAGQPRGGPRPGRVPIWQARQQPPAAESERPARAEVQPPLIPRGQSRGISPR